MNRKGIYGYVLLVGAMLIAASMPVAFQLDSSVPMITLLFYISLLGTVTSFAFMTARGTAHNLRHMLHDRMHLISVAAIGVFVFTLEPLGIAYATRHINADLVAVVFRTWPLFLVLLSPLIIKEKTTKWDILGVTIGFAGLAATSFFGTSISIPLATLPFVAIVLAIAFLEGFSTAISKRYTYELTSSVFVFNLISLLAFAPLAMLTNSWRLTSVTPKVIIALLSLGVLTEAVFNYMFYDAFRMVKTSVASTSFITVSFLTMLLAAFFLSVPVEPYYIVIAISVIIGIVVQKVAPKPVSNFIVSKSTNINPIRPVYDITSAFVGTKNKGIAETMCGDGRVLAILMDRMHGERIPVAQVSDMCGDDCLIFTDLHGMASVEEYESVRKITGAKEDHAIIIGSGEPKMIIDKLAQLEKIAIQEHNTAGQPV